MRFGRILLAVLAPLVSLPALKSDLAAAGNPATSDSLAGLLRAVVPMAAASAAETQQAAGAHAPRIASPVFESFAMARRAARLAPATEAALRLSLRRRQRALLRC